MLNLSHKTSYIWPSPHFPFRKYLDHKNLRIFIIENIHHNWSWLREHSRRFQSRDHFFVYLGWYHDDWFLKQDLAVFDALELDKSKFFFLFNSLDEKVRYEAVGFVGELINQNAWLDYAGEMVVLNNNLKKNYDALYVGRLTPFKRHHLASLVNRLALVAGNLHGSDGASDIPNYVYRNEQHLSSREVCEKINQSHCGLILSEVEGACFASSEYLLCGIPVVSTHSFGGRDVWYDDYNSIVTEANPIKIKEAVEFFINNPRDPNIIRDRHIAKSHSYRDAFISKLIEMFKFYDVDIDARQFFHDTYMHKLRESQNPNFLDLWP